MKIIHITDSHASVRPPENRTDAYYMSFLNKLAEIKFVIDRTGAQMVIHTGDLFHASRVSNRFMGQTASIIRQYSVPFYIVPGNHDLDGYSMATLDQTSLGVLVRTGVARLLDRNHPLNITAEGAYGPMQIAVSGQEYYPHIDEGNPGDFSMKQVSGDINILAYHGYIADTQQHPDIKCTYPKDVQTDANIILCGHYHRMFSVEENDTAFYNPGSMMRVDMTDYNKSHMPHYGILEINNNADGDIEYDYQFCQFQTARPSDQVFNFASGRAVKTYGITLENFKNSIANTMQNISPSAGTTAMDTVKAVISNTPSLAGMEQAVLKECQELYNDALGSVKDMDAEIKGFIPSKTRKKLAYIVLDNFRSHKHTVLKFSQTGLNIIIGESSQGKTNIFRAVNWVVNNQPPGPQVIMTGEKSCCVTLFFDDGSYVKRGRTLKDTGYYKICTGPGQPEQEFKGFANNIPAEILNVHQMPKAYITKSIQTNLNMMTQLEPPFLITDSVNEKAAAVGRITGTNVLDEAIKEAAGKMRLQKKQMQQALKDAETLEAQVKNYDKNAIKRAMDEASKLASDLKNLHSVYSRMEQFRVRNNNITSVLQTVEKDKKKAEGILSAEQDIISAEKFIKTASGIMQCMERAESLASFIKSTEARMRNAENALKLQKPVETAYKAHKSLQAPLSILTKVNAIRSSVSASKRVIDRCAWVFKAEETLKSYMVQSAVFTESFRLWHSADTASAFLKAEEGTLRVMNEVVPLMSQCVSEATDCRKCTGIYGRMLAVKDLAVSRKAEAEDAGERMKTASAGIKDMERQIRECIIAQGTCPCCGQALGRNAVEHVTAALEKGGLYGTGSNVV